MVEARRTLTQLAQMSDRELSDLGLLRADLADCTALPLDDDPGERLARARAVRAWYGRRITTKRPEIGRRRASSARRRKTLLKSATRVSLPEARVFR